MRSDRGVPLFGSKSQSNSVLPNVGPGMYNVTFESGEAVSAPVLIEVGAP